MELGPAPTGPHPTPFIPNSFPDPFHREEEEEAKEVESSQRENTETKTQSE